MPITLNPTFDPNELIYATLQRADGYWWDNNALAWAAAPATEDRKITIPEVSGINGEYLTTVNVGGPYEIDVRFFDDDDVSRLHIKIATDASGNEIDRQKEIQTKTDYLPSVAHNAAGGVRDVIFWRGLQPGNLDSNGFLPTNLASMNGNLTRVATLSSALDGNTDSINSNITRVLGSVITGTASLLAAAFSKFFNVSTPTGTVNSLPDAVPGNSDGLPRVSDLTALEVDTSDLSEQLYDVQESIDNLDVTVDLSDLSEQIYEVQEDIDVLLNMQGTGDGSVSVNHNYGGTDNLQYVTTLGAAVDNAIIRVYRSSDYTAGRWGAEYVVAEAHTDVNGRWTYSLMLDPGTYVLQAFKQGSFGPDVKNLTVT